MAKILALYGDSGCGKSTIAEMLAPEYKIFSFCTQIRKLVASKISGAPQHYLDENTYHITPDKDWEANSGFHELLLSITKEERAEAFKKSLQILDSFENLEGYIVIPDVRTDDEYYNLYFNPDARFCRIWNENCARKKSSLDGLLNDKHFDYHIDNNGSLSDLANSVESIKISHQTENN